MKKLLSIKNLSVEKDGKKIIKDLDLEIEEGKIYAIMGPNGSGKSTLAKVIAGDLDYKIKKGSIVYRGKNIGKKEPEKRVDEGIFLGHQNPVEIEGLNNIDFLHMIYNTRLKKSGGQTIGFLEFESLISDKLTSVGLTREYLTRSFNLGFSGGEKKKNEILQMLLLNPKLVILDEIDSGLDIDALKLLSSTIKKTLDKNKSIVLITHHDKILRYLEPDKILIMNDGKIIKTGNKKLLNLLEKNGYNYFLK